ncbi:MAG: methyltransferase domain-containing protein [Spirochaetales bacterium]|nr:methyltransferase domain-containing protein [Spirochaetales bacterium]
MCPIGPADIPSVLAKRAPGQRLEIEIGCGNGHFLEEYCALHPSTLYIGIELKPSRCEKACRKIQRRALGNAYVVAGRAEEVLPLMPAGSVDRVHLYFPDPWPKSRHRRRRFLRMPNLDRLAGILAPGGLILFATDFFDYYLQAKLLFAVHPDLLSVEAGLPEQAFGSVFARRFQELGKTVHRAAARRRLYTATAGSGARPQGAGAGSR